MIAQVVHGGADLLQRDARVEQPLDDLEDEDVAEAVEALRPGSVRPADARLDETRARPVVKLPVGDARRGARGGPAVADVDRVDVQAGGNRPRGSPGAVSGASVVSPQATLGCPGRLAATSLAAVVVGTEQRALLLGVRDSRSATIGRLAVLCLDGPVDPAPLVPATPTSIAS